MSLSDQQLIFAGIMMLIFLIFIAVAYRTDYKKLPKYYKGTWKIIALAAFVFLLFYGALRLSSLF